MKQNYVFGTQNRGMSPPSPAVLSPAVTKTSITSLNAQKRTESYLDSPSVHISNSALSITDQSPCSFTRPVRPFDLETIAEEHGSLSAIDSLEPCRRVAESAALPFAGIYSQEIAGSHLDTALSDATVIPASSMNIPASASLKSDFYEPRLDSADRHELFVQLPICENSTINPTDDVPFQPDACESEEPRDMSANVDREISDHLATSEATAIDQATDCCLDVNPPVNFSVSNFTDNDIDLRNFNYCVNLPKVTGKAVFDSIDNLLINFAGNYQSNLFMDELSMLIIKHFNLNIDLSVASEQKFNNLKMFDFNKPGSAPVDYSTMSNRRLYRV